MDAELEARRDLRQRLLGALAAGQAVGDDADLMAAIGLSIGEVQDVAKDAANRSTQRMQDTKRLTVDHGHDHNQRSPTKPPVMATALSSVMLGT